MPITKEREGVKDLAEEATVVTLPLWNELFEFMRDQDYGTVFTHEDIEGVIGVPQGEGDYYRAVGRCAEEMWTVQKHMENVHGQGYRIVMPNEHVGQSTKKMQQAVKKMRQGVMVSGATNDSLLSDEERRNLDDHNARIVRVVGGVDKSWLSSHDQKKLAVTPLTDRMLEDGEK